jgi:hypothetical protein
MNNRPKHTSGPWRWVQIGPASIPGSYSALYGADTPEDRVNFEDPIIDDGSCYGEDQQDIEFPDSPDALLIAAAPDMLAALKDVANMVQSSLPPCIRAPVEAAIEKAEGVTDD